MWQSQNCFLHYSPLLQAMPLQPASEHWTVTWRTSSIRLMPQAHGVLTQPTGALTLPFAKSWAIRLSLHRRPRYAAVLARTLKYHSVKQYLHIVKTLHSEWGLADPLAGDYYLQCTVRGIQCNLGEAQNHKAPLTPELLIQILSKLDLNRLEDAAFWASLLLMFFAMLRVSNVLCKVTSCDHSRHLIPSDLHFHHKGMDLAVRSTKTIQFQGRRLIYPFRKSTADTVLCPIKAVVLYLALSPPLPPSGPLFVSSGSGQPLTATTLATRLKTILKDLGITAGVISCHSARRGGACLAYKLQIPIDTIRLIGDWRSNCYMKYIEVESPLVGKALHNMVSNALQS